MQNQAVEKPSIPLSPLHRTRRAGKNGVADAPEEDRFFRHSLMLRHESTFLIDSKNNYPETSNL
jgi:hypothetical protein